MKLRLRVGLVMMPFAVAACDVGSLTEPSPTTCSEAGTQCRLAEGPLGVCERSSCAPGATAPCFQCVPQH